MNEISQSAKEIKIQKLSLTTVLGEVNLFNVFTEIQIFEDIYSPTLSGSISLSESRNLPELAKLQGGEKIFISFKTGVLNEFIDLEFYIDKISERIITKEKNAIYVIHFVSREKIYDTIRKVSRAYKNQPMSFYIEDALKSSVYGCSSEKEFIKEDSLYVSKIVVPMWSPLKTISWMASRCVSPLYTSSPYVFFENKKGFQLSSLENLFNQPVYETYTYAPKNAHNYRNIFNDLKKVESYSAKRAINYLDKISSGGYSSKLYTFDLATKKFVSYNYNYEDNLVHKFKLPIETENKFEDVSLNTSFDSTLSFAYKQTEVDDGNNYVEAWSQSNQSNFFNLESISLDIEIPGNSSLNVGNVIQFDVPSYASSDNVKKDKILSGRYLVTALAHFITPDKYEMKAEICKDTFFRQLDGVGKQIQ